MKIKNQFILSIIVFISILLIVVLSLAIIYLQINQIHEKIAVASNIHSSANDLNQISDTYLIFQENAQIKLWNEQFSSISNNITLLSSMNLEQQSIVTVIENDSKQLNDSFSDFISFLQNTPRNQSVRASPEFQAIWSQLSDKIHAIIVNSEQLSQELNIQSENLHLSYAILVVILLIAFGVYLSVMYFIVYYRTLRSISRLQDGLTIVGSGNLDYAIKAEKDEVGELSNSFNRMTANLKNVTSQLRNAERLAAIGQVAGMVGHDIRNPLQAITSELYLAENGIDELPENSQRESLKESLAFIEKQADYIDKIIKDLQDYSRPLKPDLVEVDLCTAVPDAISAVEIPNNIQSNIVCSDSALQLKVDVAFLKRIMINLVTNAIQAMPHGGKLAINVFSEKGSAVITVQDTGVGIPKDKQEKLFTPLFTTKAKGQGFGLVTIKRMAEALGGTISFESQEGKGAKFIVRLPQK